MKNVLSIPISRKRQKSMQRMYVIFSSILFLLIFIPGIVTFIILMNKIQYKDIGDELIQTIKIERLKLETSLNSQIALALKMANSPLIKRYFLNSSNSELQKIAFEELAGYRKAFASNSIFWVNDVDKKFFQNESYEYTIDTTDSSNDWYSMALDEEKEYNFNISYDPNLNRTNLQINVPIIDNNYKPIGIVGANVNLSDFIDTLYQNYSGVAKLYFLKVDGEITGANDVALVENKVNIIEVLGKTGTEILAKTKGLKVDKEIEYYFEAKNKKQIVAVGSIPDLNWYITATRSIVIDNSMRGITLLFAIMMVIVFAIYVIFNIFVFGMLEPLNNMVKTINQTLFDWELKPYGNNYNSEEIGSIGEFLNLTIIDQLTGVYKRRYMDGHLKKVIKSLDRTNTNLSLLLVDIDYFKKYNDTYGHDAGNNCLRVIASTLIQCVSRDVDFVARYGGEKFAIVLPNTDKNGLHMIAKKLLEKVRECKIPNKASHIADYVTISIGGTTSVVKHLQQSQDYIKAADKALYESKKNGRDRYTYENFEERISV